MYRKETMKKFYIKKYIKKTIKQIIKPIIKKGAIQIACLSMVISPVALGKEAETINEKYNKKYLQQTLKEFGLDKNITLAEFWEKSKVHMPSHIYNDLEEFVKNNKNLQMPEVALGGAQATDGTEIPVMTFSQNGKTSRAEFYLKNNKWIKFNSVNISELDLRYPQYAFKRLEASDIKLKKEADQYRKNMSLKQKKNHTGKEDINIYQKDFSRFSGFPRITPQMWKSLTKEQRVGYFVKMRLLWRSARKVLSQAPSSYSRAPDYFYKIIFGQNAQAKAAKQTPSAKVQVAGTTVRTKQGKLVQIPYDAKSCVVAGYIGSYGKVNNINGNNRDGCSIDIAIATYKSNENLKFVQVANDECAAEKSTQVACNPIIYGFPGGQAACIDRGSLEYQHATHFTSDSGNKTCDGKSRLSTSAEVIKFNGKDYSVIQPREKQIAEIEADQQKEDYILTQNYIKGVLLKKDPFMTALLEKGEWNIDLDNELVRIQFQFEEQIEIAIKTCEADISGKHEKNQKAACDQLHRRWLFTERSIAQLRENACLKPAHYIGSYNTGEASYSVTAKNKTALNKKTIDEKGRELCQCPENSAPAQRVAFAQACVIIGPVPVIEPAALAQPVVPAAIAPSTNWVPWAMGAFGLAILAAIYHHHKKKLALTSTAHQAVPPPISIPVPNLPLPAPLSCAPKIGTPPNCVCPDSASCAPPQQIYNHDTCQCTNIAQAYVCADASPAPNGNLLQCPKCSDGSFTTTSGCPIEGGDGNNCPQGNCSGGLPETEI